MARWENPVETALLLTRDGARISGFGAGAAGSVCGEVCFNTAMTGYQEIITDPSYSDQIITFTFPHIGNVGANRQDVETSDAAKPPMARGIIIGEGITEPANYRAETHLDDWLKAQGVIALCGVDTRAITRHIREDGMFDAVLAHDPQGQFDIDKLTAELAAFKGLKDADLAGEATTAAPYDWRQGRWSWEAGFQDAEPRFHVVAMDFGIKRNILRCLASAGCRITIVPADTTAEAVLAHKPDGVFLSNGPGDPAATRLYAAAELAKLVAHGVPIFGICLGHQILAHALGAQTMKMPQGHHGANHPVQDLTTGKVEITSMNHGFTIARDTLPDGVIETHISLFDRTNCGIAVAGKPVFSVQYHPEASPGPQDSHYLFDRFTAAMAKAHESR